MKKKELKLINYQIYKYRVFKDSYVLSLYLNFRISDYRFCKEIMYRENKFYIYENYNSYSFDSLDELRIFILSKNSFDYSKYIPDEFFEKIIAAKFLNKC